MVQGQVFLQGGADTFPIHFFQGLSFFHLETTLPFAKLCYVFEKKKIFFFCHRNSMKKVILSCLKMNLKISRQLRSLICKGI